MFNCNEKRLTMCVVVPGRHRIFFVAQERHGICHTINEQCIYKMHDNLYFVSHFEMLIQDGLAHAIKTTLGWEKTKGKSNCRRISNWDKRKTRVRFFLNIFHLYCPYFKFKWTKAAQMVFGPTQNARTTIEGNWYKRYTQKCAT